MRRPKHVQSHGAMKIVFYLFVNCLCQNPNLIFSVSIDVVPISIAVSAIPILFDPIQVSLSWSQLRFPESQFFLALFKCISRDLNCGSCNLSFLRLSSIASVVISNEIIVISIGIVAISVFSSSVQLLASWSYLRPPELQLRPPKFNWYCREFNCFCLFFNCFFGFFTWFWR